MQDTNFEIQFSNYDDSSILHIYFHFYTTLHKNHRCMDNTYTYLHVYILSGNIYFQYVNVILAVKFMTPFPKRPVLKRFLLESL